VPSISRSRTLAAPPDAVWAVVADPHHQPRWWPRVERVEGADAERFTQLLRTGKGRAVRADFRRLGGEEGRRVAWEQVVENTPFERLLHSARTEVALDPQAEGTRVTLTMDQKLRGWSRVGPFFFTRAGKRTLDEALDGLERACVP
jgi:uncharacterized protein YndB with AHSA1/START domain